MEGTDIDTSDPRTLGNEILFEKMEYGEDETDALEHNLRGHLVRHFDGAGVVVTDRFDFKGNPLRSSRQLAAEYREIPDWSGSPGLESEEFVNKSVFDAVGRPIEIEKPDGSIVEITYDQAGFFKAIDAKAVDDSGSGPTFGVTDITYDAKGQRQSIEYDNGVETEYEYDRFTFQLKGLKTTRDASDVLQDIHYTYDPMGNITSIRDHAQQTLFYDNGVVEPHKAYAYDSLYRLIETSGREHEGQSGQVTPTSWNDEHRTGLAHKHDGQAMRTYDRGYEYDQVGNLSKMRHQAGTLSWKRLYEYGSTGTPEPEDNRLTKTTVGSDESVYSHDTHGNMTDMPHLSVLEWDFKDQMFATSKQVVSEGDPETTYYVYDSAGERVRKVTDRASTSGDPNRKSERIYLGGFEIYREYENTSGEPIESERKTLHVMDNARRVALIETKTIDASQTLPDPQPLLRHQLGDHLESSSIELDEQGDIISYEEYYPYGSTSYQAVDSQTEVSGKRYRFTGKERDEESGLYYHGARYYAPWLSRWTAADPAGMVDGPNLYAYVRGNPVRLVDPDGMESIGSNWVGQASNAIKESAEATSQITDATETGDSSNFWSRTGETDWHDEFLKNVEAMELVPEGTSEIVEEEQSDQPLETREDPRPTRFLPYGANAHSASAFLRIAGLRSAYIVSNRNILNDLDTSQPVSDRMADRAIRQRRVNEINTRSALGRYRILNDFAAWRNLRTYGDRYGLRDLEHANQYRQRAGKSPRTNAEHVDAARHKTNFRANVASGLLGVAGLYLSIADALITSGEYEETGRVTVSPGVQFAPDPSVLEDGTRVIAPRSISPTGRGVIYQGEFHPDPI